MLSGSEKITLVLVRGRGRGSIQVRLSKAALTVFSLAVVLLGPATLGFLSAQDFAPDLSALTAHAYRLNPTRLGASLRDNSRAIAFEDTGQSLLVAPPRLIVEAPPGSEERVIATPEERRGILRVQSLHLGEAITVRPFDQNGNPNADAFKAINHLWRCRFTDHEVDVDPRLVRLLTELNDIYDRPIHLVSGHRTPNTVGTRPTSQHNAGTAADIRVPGVSSRELQTLTTALGARGVGLYTHKHFVHVDFRKKKKFFWVYPEVGHGNQVASAPVPSTGAM